MALDENCLVVVICEVSGGDSWRSIQDAVEVNALNSLQIFLFVVGNLIGLKFGVPYRVSLIEIGGLVVISWGQVKHLEFLRLAAVNFDLLFAPI